MSLLRVTLWDVPALFVGAAMVFGGLIPFWDAPAGSVSPSQAQPILLFDLRKRRDIVDTLMAMLCYVGAVDGYACYLEGQTGHAVFRFASGLVIGAWGWFGLTY